MHATVPQLVREILRESLSHAMTMVPLLFGVFLIVEAFSHGTNKASMSKAMGHPVLGPVAAAALGLVPQCGFSVAATTLYLDGIVPTGSLLAAYIATSDEAVPILVADPGTTRFMVPLLATKIVWGALAGTIVNLAQNRRSKTTATPGGETSETGSHSCVGQQAEWNELVPHAAARAVRITAMVFVFSSLLNLLGHLLAPGVERALGGSGVLQPLATSFLGLIPSCATSVGLAEGFRTGYLSFPALVSGLTANSGVGLLVLIKESKRPGDTLSVAVLLVVSALTVGFLASLLTL
ncbi:MAG: putative manganese transporter [Bacillota bacterium]